MNISLIHIFELITLLLVVGKLFQIRRLYRRSGSENLRMSALPHVSAGATKKPVAQNLRHTKKASSAPHTDASFLSNFKENYAFNYLPLPEVSFTEGLPLPEVSYSHGVTQSFPTKKPNSSKTILTNYIDDLFFESPRTVFPQADVVDFQSYKLDAYAEDEFITVDDEHDEIVRAFDSLENNVYLIR